MCDQKNGGDHDDDVDELSASDDSEPEERLSSAAFVPELDEDDDDDDDDGEVVTSAPAVGAQSPFSLRGGGSAFSDRSHSIFDCLDSVARLTSSSSSFSSSLKQENATDGVFARPLPPPPSRKTRQPPPSGPTPAKKKGAPDYLVHPERWTHYSLEDVSETSDQGNSRAALNYLSSLQQQRKEQQESPSDSSCNTQQKMVFRPSRPQKEQPADQSSAVRSREKETRLSHLEEEEDDDEEEPKAGGGRTDQSAKKAEDIERDEDKDLRGAVGRPEEQEKGDDEEEKIEEANPSFTSFRKTKHKNYRKSSGREDN
ncbi:U5 small nuclear ribonucleoprotein TSSC4 isoform 1-T2 [Symphorus nematophorus]